MNHRPSQLRAFTLVEMVLAASVTGVVMAACVSLTLIAGRAVPDSKNDPVAALSRANRAADLIADDVACATEVVAKSATSLELTVTDRDGNGVSDRVRYAWSGVVGEPLTRAYSVGGPTAGQWLYEDAVAIATDVRELTFGFDTTRQPIEAASTAEGAEQLLFSMDGLLSLFGATVSSSNWRSQSFVPSLPSNATAWRVTRVRFKAKTSSTANGSMSVQIRRGNGAPWDTPMASATVLESSFGSSYGWQEVSFNNATELPAGSNGHITFQWLSGSDSGNLQTSTLTSSLLGAAFYTSSNSGSSWGAGLLTGLPCDVYGRVTRPTNVATQYRYHLSRVRLTLRSGADARRRVEGVYRAMNSPEVTAP